MRPRLRVTAPLAGLIAATALVAATCSRGGLEFPPVILVTFDTTRADHVSAYGYERKTTPRVEEMIASRAVRFDRMTAASNNTSCSFASVHSGVHVRTHGVIKLSPFGYPLDPAFKTLGEILGELDYFRVAAVGAAHLNAVVSGLGRGFDKYFDFDHPGLDQLKRPCEETNAALIPFLEKTYRGGEKKPLFLWLHYFDPHFPYEPPAPYDTAFAYQKSHQAAPPLPQGFKINDPNRDVIENIAKHVALYDGEILRTDHAMGEVLDSLRRLGILDKAIVVFTADHGENLGEHNLYCNHSSLYQPVIHVPLLIHLPGMTQARVSDALVHHVDIMPTILDAVGVPQNRWPQGLEGRSLLPILKSRETTAHDEVFSEAAQYREKAIIRDRLKLIVDSSLQKHSLYDLAKDPGELHDIGGKEPGATESLLSELEKFIGSRTYHFKAVVAKDAPGPRSVLGRVRARKKLDEMSPEGFAKGDIFRDRSEGGGPCDADVRFTVAPGESKGIKATVPYGALILDVASPEAPIDPESLWLGGKRPRNDQSILHVIMPGEKDSFPEKAPTNRPALVRVEEQGSDADSDSARYRFTLGPCEPGTASMLVLRGGTDGVVSEAKRISGSLSYEGFDLPDRFRVISDTPADAGVFELSVHPASAAFFIEGKVDDRKIANTEFRRGPKGPDDDRAYLTTIFISPNMLQAEADSSDVRQFIEKPGFHIWSDLPPGRHRVEEVVPDPAEAERLRKLGYVNGPGGAGVKAEKTDKAEKEQKKETKPAPDQSADPSGSGSSPAVDNGMSEVQPGVWEVSPLAAGAFGEHGEEILKRVVLERSSEKGVRGLRVTSIPDDRLARMLQVGDVVRAINGRVVSEPGDVEEITRSLGSSKARQLRVDFIRSSKPMSVTFRLRE